jgi:hypothetical protein
MSPQRSQNKRLTRQSKVLSLSREALELIDSTLQPYCEDRLSRQSVIDTIQMIVYKTCRDRKTVTRLAPLRIDRVDQV